MRRFEINQKVIFTPKPTLKYEGTVKWTEGGNNGLALVEFTDPRTQAKFRKWVPRKGTEIIYKATLLDIQYLRAENSLKYQDNGNYQR